ncbi:MAG TPA: IPT/TIG domain-containing protein [Pyrinomonadaceae bacterium]|nr:IPT/TIG domain-containing protein [Pyrinomonadaceae bacterium]
MQAVDLTKPGETKKLIGAAILGLVALLVLWWALFGFGSSSSPSTTPARAAATPVPARGGSVRAQTQPVSPNIADLATYGPIVYQPSAYTAPEAKRNIFAYYVPPPKPQPVVKEAPATPTPPPPLLLASVSPSNVFARSPEFKLEAAGDKFTPATKIYFEGRELPTTYTGPQQLSAMVPASMFAAPGSRNVIVRTDDNSLYSNPLTVSVAAPPVPNYLYVGIIGEYTRVGDTALVQDKSNKNILSVHRGEPLGGRFRVTSISDKELVLMDTTLKIKHTLAMTEGDRSSGNPLTRPTPRVEAEDDEP